MYRVSPANVSVRRTCEPLYERHQATPVECSLDPTLAAATTAIYSGMVMSRTGADTVGIYDSSDDNMVPWGLAALDRNTEIDDLDGLDSPLFSVWQGGPDAYFKIHAPAFDTEETWTVPTDGSMQPVYADASGVLVTTDDGHPIGELVEVIDENTIVIRLGVLPTSTLITPAP